MGGERVSVSVDVVIFSLREDDLKVLLVRRAAPPYKGKWAIPGGFVQADESLDEAARRELAEETGVHGVYLEQLYTFGEPQRDPRGRVITVAYFALVADDVALRAGDDAAEAGWHSVYALPELAFDHAEILKYALQRLRYKLEYTSVGFELLPNEFTLSELQTAYETVLGLKEVRKKLDKRNFRRRILEAGILAEISKYREGEGQGRPARLYRYKKNAVTEVKARRLFP
ncbi:MAG TPA: NUDIX domain-containing protein [Anaerolineales bacterium]|nr:NUDIX domain-containing protein [Anaerolineales bacterium]